MTTSSPPNPWPLIERWFPKRNEWSRTVHAGWSLALFIVLAGLPYSLVNRIAGWRGVSVLNVETTLDTMLPFVPAMLWLYVSFYAYFPVLFWLGSHPSRRWEAERVNQRLIQATWLVFVVFLLLPVEVDLRHQVPPGTGLEAWLTSLLHAIDTPYNAWPSLHVLQGLLVVLCVQTWMRNEQRLSPSVNAGLWLAWALLCLSTVLVKQHYVFDVVTGAAGALLVWRWWFRPVFNRTTG